MRDSTSTNANMLTGGFTRPRIRTTSTGDGTTMAASPNRPEDPQRPRLGVLHQPARHGAVRIEIGVLTGEEEGAAGQLRWEVSET
jgi:hypothetical protein